MRKVTCRSCEHGSQGGATGCDCMVSGNTYNRKPMLADKLRYCKKWTRILTIEERRAHLQEKHTHEPGPRQGPRKPHNSPAGKKQGPEAYKSPGPNR